MREGIRKNIKRLIPIIVLSLVCCFMMFIYEPIVMYSNNQEDFWFDFYSMIPPVIISFIVSFVVCLIIGIAIYFLTKGNKIYDIIIIVLLDIFLILYIHGSFLAGMLPELDGSAIDWTGTMANGVSIAVCAIIIFVTIFLCKKKSVKTIAKYSIYPILLVFCMLIVSLITTCFNTDLFKQKTYSYAKTTKNFDTISNDENFIILVLDSVDSKKFNKVIQSNKEYQDYFKDFTYYPDTMSAYPFTRDSIPFLITGIWNENTTDFANFSTNAYDQSPLISKLKNENYSINLYSEDIIWQSEGINDISNFEQNKSRAKIGSFIKQELKYIAFKYLPYPLKKYSKIEGLNFDIAREYIENDTVEEYSCLNTSIMEYVSRSQELQVTDTKMFQFVHFEAAHLPFDMDENLQDKENATYEDKLKASLTVLGKYLERLKSNNAYDNSAIMIISDHGYNYEENDPSQTSVTSGRQNSILYVKGIGEKHDSMMASNKAVSQADFQEIYSELIDGKDSDDILSNIDTNRTRRYIYHEFLHEDHFVEYEQTGKAWQLDTLLPTGNEYNL